MIKVDVLLIQIFDTRYIGATVCILLFFDSIEIDWDSFRTFT